MPARTTVAPGRPPEGFPLLLRLPENKIQRILLLLFSGNLQGAFSASKIVQILVRQLAIALETSGSEIDRTVFCHIGMSTCNQFFNHGNHAVDFFCRKRMFGGRQDIHRLHIFFAFFNISLRNHRSVHIFLVGSLDDFIIDIREIGNVVDLIPAVHKIAAYRVKKNHRSGVPDMNQVVYGRSADIHAHLVFFNRHKILDLPRHGIKNLNHPSSLPPSPSCNLFCFLCPALRCGLIDSSPPVQSSGLFLPGAKRTLPPGQKA